MFILSKNVNKIKIYSLQSSFLIFEMSVTGRSKAPSSVYSLFYLLSDNG